MKLISLPAPVHPYPTVIHPECIRQAEIFKWCVTQKDPKDCDYVLSKLFMECTKIYVPYHTWPPTI